MAARHPIALLLTVLAAAPAGAANETPWLTGKIPNALVLALQFGVPF